VDPEAGMNGSFEVVESGIPVNWSFDNNPDMQVFTDTTRVVDGKRSLKVTVEYDVNGRIPSFRGLRIPVLSGKNYRISVSVINDGCSFRLNRIVQDSSGKTNTRADIIARAVALASPDTWESYEEILSVVGDESYVILAFLVKGHGTLWCDDVRVEELEESPR
jgi:hypothetical protein